jgi:hypothetical protein
MKAEHRKELQTNSLADLLGRTVRKARSGGGISWFTVFVVVFLVVAALGYLWVRKNKNQVSAEAWARLEFNDRKSLEELASESSDTKQGQAARFTIGYGYLWDGIRLLGAGDSKYVQGGISYLSEAVQVFSKLADECKDDNEQLAEAKYHLAVAFEALAGVLDVKILEEAQKNFEELTKGDLAATPYGVLAKRRLEQYTNPAEHAAMIMFYKNFRSQTPVRSGQ